MNLARRVTLSFALSGMLAVEAVAGGFQLNEHGARAMAQAGAFVARASDGSAVFFNPAGLAFQDQISVYGGVTAVIPTVSFYGPLQNNTNAKTQAPNQFFSPINAYVTYPAFERLHVGIGVNNPYGLGSEWPDTWIGRYLTTYVSLHSFYFSPTVSYKITDDLAVGGGFNYVTGSVSLERAVAIPLQAADGDPKVTLDLTGHGYGWNAGALYKITRDISIGASYRSSVKMDASGTASFNPNYAPLDLPAGGVTTSIKLPATAFAGLAWTPAGEKYQIEADYQWIGWSSYNQLAFTFQADGSQVIQPKNYSDTYILRIGGEYALGDFRIRGGYLFDHSPVSTEYVDPILPDANRNGINLGLGYSFSKEFSVDVAYLLLLFNERKAVNTTPTVNFDGTYHTHVSLFGVNLGYSI